MRFKVRLYDFTGKVGNGTKHYRGGYEYQRPYGWKRYAIKVLGIGLTVTSG